MARYFIEIAYKGTSYHGWQRQQNAVSIQEILEKTLAIVLGETIETCGCGRTDTGVHAKQFFVHFDTEKTIDNNLKYNLNGILPKDITVKRIVPVDEHAHARFDATSRSYEYHINFLPDPFVLEFSYYYRWKLNLKAMNEAASLLLTHKDFSCFSKSNTQVKTFLCDVTRAVWEQQNNNLVFYISANRFLRNMVRAIVGTLLEVGKGDLDIKGFGEIIESKNRSEAGVSVPACGLFLTEVSYPYLMKNH